MLISSVPPAPMKLLEFTGRLCVGLPRHLIWQKRCVGIHLHGFFEGCRVSKGTHSDMLTIPGTDVAYAVPLAHR